MSSLTAFVVALTSLVVAVSGVLAIVLQIMPSISRLWEHNVTQDRQLSTLAQSPPQPPHPHGTVGTDAEG